MIALIEYGAGNTASVANALDNLNERYILTSSEQEICKADKVIFPGVGEASFAIRQLHKYNLINLLRIIKKPVLGICLGMQLLCDYSFEGNVTCLGIIPGKAQKFDPTQVKVPHMGWNEVFPESNSKLFKGISAGEFFYFAHSYYLPPGNFTSAKSNHGIDFSAALEKDNFFGLQFHPEKSGDAGMKVIKNFLNI